MISGRSLISKSKAKANSATTAGPSTDNSGFVDNVASLEVPSLPIPASGDASSNHSSSTNLPGPSPPDCPVRGVTSRAGYDSPIDKSDVIIAVMGPTGVGKSSFVNSAAGRSEVVIGYDLKTHTRSVQPVRCYHPDDSRRNIVLVDTPGFDDTHLSDVQILRIIANWLKETYQKDIKLAGILYLHRISDNRLAGTPLKNLAVFRELCGDDNLKNIALVTTMWDDVESQSVGSMREEQLRSRYWKDMLLFGSNICRFQGTRESAWEIINRLDLESSLQTRTPLRIQKEMVDRRLPLPETSAGKTLLRFLVDEFKRVWTRMRTRIRVPIGTRRRPSGGNQRTALSRSSTIRSGPSETTLSMVSSNSSDSSLPSQQPSPADSTSSACSIDGRRDTLLGIITALRIAYQMADMSGIPMLRGAIGTALQIAQVIEGMGGTHHAISQVIEYSGWLLQELAQYATETRLSRDMKKTLKIFQKELDILQTVVRRISTRGHITRFFLYEADIQALTACTASIRAVYNKLEIRLALDNHQAITRLEAQLAAFSRSREPRQCECGKRLAIQEELQEDEQSSTSESS